MTDVLEYLSEGERIHIAREVFTQMCREKFMSDSERIFSNAAYRAVWRVVDEVFDGKAAELIAAKVPKVIEELSPFSIFRTGGYGNQESVGQKVLDQCIRNNSDRIDAAIKAAAATISKDDIINAIENGTLQFTIGARE